MTATATEPISPNVRTGLRWMLLIVLGGQAMASMDGSIVNVALPSIQATLAASGAELQLVAAAYLLSFAALVVPAARLGDRYGQTRVFRYGMIGFTAASLACGLCGDPVALIVVRLIQGAAGALMVAQVVALLHLGFHGPTRTRAIAWYSLVLALGVAAGQVAGGALVAANLGGLSWRIVFLVNVPIGAALALMSRRLPATTPGPAGRPDLTGAAILAGSIAAAVGALTVGREQGWPAWSLAMLLAGVAGLAGFAAYEGRLSRVVASAPAPLLEIRALRAPGVGTGLIACFLVMGAYSGYLFALTLFLQSELGFSPLRSGLTFLPYAAGFGTVGLLWRRLPAGFAKWAPPGGPIAFAIGITALALISTRHWPTPAGVALLVVAGAGHAAAFSPLFARITTLTAARYASSLSAAVNTGTLLASSVMVSVLGGIFLSTGRNGGGIVPVAIAADAVLIATAACAGWTVTRPTVAAES